jgi:lactococcin 972 family bacteriocin
MGGESCRLRAAALPGDRKDGALKKISRVLATAGLAAGLVVVGCAMPAEASYSNVQVGGGWWAYGTGIYTYSDFTQNQKIHRSSVEVDGQLTRSLVTAPGGTSKASRKTGRIDYAYWANF